MYKKMKNNRVTRSVKSILVSALSKLILAYLNKGHMIELSSDKIPLGPLFLKGA